jgi:hypothetical protein
MNRYPNLRGVALSVLLAAFFGLLLQTSLARASTITVTSGSGGASCSDNPGTLRCANKAANSLGTFNKMQFSQSVPLAPASTTITVTGIGDGTNCIIFETLRCAINQANASGTFNTIQFSPAVTQVMLATTLPTITGQGTFINGFVQNGGWVIIDAAGLSTGNVLVINASDVLIAEVSIINTPSNAADIQILGGMAVRITYNYLGVIPGAANCNFSRHTRNSGIGVDVATNAGSSGTGSAYIFGNVIGCHSYGQSGKGISLEASWTYVGQDADGGIHPNDIGVEPSGSSIPNDAGVTLISGGGVFTAANNSVLSNTIADNVFDGIELGGAVTSRNLISGTVIYGNGLDGICENDEAPDNVWTHVSIYDNGGFNIFNNGALGINKNGHCFGFVGRSEAIDPPYPVITLVDPATHVVHGTASPNSACPVFCVTVELYRVFPNRRGFGEGKTFVGATATDSQGKWSLIDPAFAGGCYTAFQTTSQFFISGTHYASSEFGPDNCRTWLPLTQR